MSDIYLSENVSPRNNQLDLESVNSEDDLVNKGSDETLYQSISRQNKNDLEKSLVILKQKHEEDTNPFSAFRYFPGKMNFFNKDPNEKIILLLRKHPITNVPWILASFLLVVIPSFLSALSPFESFPTGYKVIFLLTWYLLTFAYTLESFLSWFFNVNIITDERIFDVDFNNLIYRKITDAGIDEVQDVTVVVGSAIRTIFNYGDIKIQTASEVPELEFEAVPFPDKVARILRELRIQEEVEKLEGRLR